MGTGRARHVLVAAGGTGGHLFPAEALAAALGRRGVGFDLATDERAVHYGGNFPARATHIIPSATVRGRDPFSLMKTAGTIGGGIVKSWALLGDLKPVVVIGFGGYPTLPPLLAASLRGIPTIIHEQNAVMGRANRFLAKRVTAIATGFRGLAMPTQELGAKTTWVGNPVRPAVILASSTPYAAPEIGGKLKPGRTRDVGRRAARDPAARTGLVVAAACGAAGARRGCRRGEENLRRHADLG